MKDRGVLACKGGMTGGYNRGECWAFVPDKRTRTILYGHTTRIGN